ncbi:MAG: enoyl-CoA hydratase/isomerase family protein [Planctomycetes bacterium]|nr:enoyl-CoA hydratase/isomerase family protein [Planctomycetota bacterium]
MPSGVAVELGRLPGREVEGEVATVALDRPEVHNAFDDELIEELSAVLADLARREGLRALVLTGRGRSFSAGADLDWMRRAAGWSEEENLADARRLAALLGALDEFPRPTVAVVQGPAYGGGVGLAAACDLVLAAREARLTLSEVRLGVVPAVIAPYVVRRVGPARARALFLSSEPLEAERALAWGLADRVAPAAELGRALGEVLALVACGAPGAQAAAKGLVARVAGRPPAQVRDETAALIARLRAGAEGREGLSAFLEKRRPSWAPPDIQVPPRP